MFREALLVERVISEIGQDRRCLLLKCDCRINVRYFILFPISTERFHTKTCHIYINCILLIDNRKKV